MDAKKKDKQNEENDRAGFSVQDRRHWVLEGEGQALEDDSKERLPTYVEELKQQAEEKDKKLREYIAAYKSKTAETDEFRARLQKENENQLDQIKANFFKELIPIMDNLKRALDSTSSSSDFESLKEGVAMIHSQLLSKLQDNGVEMIPTVDRQFDPQTDEAFMTVETQNPEEDNKIVEELEPGYLFKSKLLKAAKVKVAKLKT
ncbi:MAG: nucleotide exchange factor GrpE [Nitrospinaceae bacterium]|nr:nucleotide exchange factor GrpE [Nitrospinaceae bacterium]NIR57246.1 nucleotide exchange factor GrpE [Nitrospinaceae bacterium]NIS87694.1 nucleotide exchange factor GrpE [Nitrospinaceae bacterium]NIT84560.1 nucleotide exchange factor GrpE [Nitrospinaceae bacterium]NIU46746.1 nucleotide exchange factor GrpE [Nitrospinaceae bacterium]